MEEEGVWLTQRQLAELLDTSTNNIRLYLKSTNRDGELEEPAATEEFSVVQAEGKHQVA